MVGTEFLDVTIATDDHNEDLVSVESRQGIVVVNNGSASAFGALSGKSHEKFLIK